MTTKRRYDEFVNKELEFQKEMIDEIKRMLSMNDVEFTDGLDFNRKDVDEDFNERVCENTIDVYDENGVTYEYYVDKVWFSKDGELMVNASAVYNYGVDKELKNHRVYFQLANTLAIYNIVWHFFEYHKVERRVIYSYVPNNDYVDYD